MWITDIGIIFIFVIQIHDTSGINFNKSSSSPSCSSTSSSPPPTLEIVVDKHNQSLFYSVLQIKCVAKYPINWEFIIHPHSILSPQNSRWNATYARIVEDVFQDEGQHEPGGALFVSLISFENVTVSQLHEIDGQCRTVIVNEEDDAANRCLSNSIIQAVLITANYSGGGGNSNTNEHLEKPKTEMTGKNNCSLLDLWFNEKSQHFLCKRKDEDDTDAPEELPVLNVRYCSNPTECGFPTKDDCWSHPSSPPSHTGRLCTAHPPNERSCQSLQLSTEFPIPKLISCSRKNETAEMKVMGYFHSIVQIDGHPVSSYVNWETVDPSDLMQLQPTKYKVMANETVDILCSASYYYFAAGLHFTIKKISGGDDEAESDFKKFFAPGRNNFTHIGSINETLEWWISNGGLGHHLPLKRNMLADDVILPSAGDYEIACYAPVWNSTEWGRKSMLISVANVSTPTFVSGNDTSTISFSVRRNVTCLAKGVPPPRLTWITGNGYKVSKGLTEISGQSKFVSWSVITLPESMEGIQELELKCHAENDGGYSEKLFVITNHDQSLVISTKLAATIVLLGFILNVVVLFICWQKLFGDDDDDEDEGGKDATHDGNETVVAHQENPNSRKRTTWLTKDKGPLKFLRRVWAGERFWCKDCSNETKIKDQCNNEKCKMKSQKTQTA